MEFLTLSEQEYLSYFDTCKYQNFWQSVEMANMRKQKGWEIHYIGVKKDGILCGACALESVIVYRKYRLFMALRGFLIDYHDEEILRYFLGELINYIQQRNCMYMKLDPYIAYQPHDIDGKIIAGALKEDKLIAILKEFGFVHQGFRTQHDDEFEPRWMSVLEVEGKSEEELLKQMQSMTRRSIQGALKNGIKLKKLKRDELSILEKVVEDTGNRKHFNKPDLAYYESFYDHFKEHMEAVCSYLDTQDYCNRIQKELDLEIANKTKIEEALIKNPEAQKTKNRLKVSLEAIHTIENRLKEAYSLQEKYGDEIPLAASLFVKYKNEIIYLFGGSYTEFQKFKGSFAIQWKLIQETLTSGIPRYNFYGISGNFHEDAEDYGVYLFKKGFHADVVELIGDFIYVGNTSAYRQYQLLRKIKHKILHR